MFNILNLYTLVCVCENMKANQRKNHMAIVVNDETFTNTTRTPKSWKNATVYLCVCVFFRASKYTWLYATEWARVREREHKSSRQ